MTADELPISCRTRRAAMPDVTLTRVISSDLIGYIRRCAETARHAAKPEKRFA